MVAGNALVEEAEYGFAGGLVVLQARF